VTHLGYAKIDSARPIWKHGNKKILICLADDFRIHSQNVSRGAANWFDSNTTVITDNHLLVPAQYQVCELPSSYFGVFSYSPADQNHCLGARFHLSVNRFDHQRLQILLEFINQAGSLDQILDKDYINFNCWKPDASSHSTQDIKNTVIQTWQDLPSIHSTYQDIFQELIQHVPLRNHTLSIEQAHVSSQLNLVIETYAGDGNIAFSEKIFRALVTPAPWTLFSAKNAIHRLRTLGFDVLDDLIPHNEYDCHPHNEYKIKHYISSSLAIQKILETYKFDDVRARCVGAALHNQQLLDQMKLNWPSDLADYILDLVQQIKLPQYKRINKYSTGVRLQ
jgi:hypothetical protein